jgi:hypothetical protein
LEAAFSSQEYITAAKRAGVYASLLQWMAAYRRGERTVWPGSAPAVHAPPRFTVPRQPQGFGASDPRIPQMNAPRKEVKENTLATVPPPKRALDTLHESYRVLELDDTKPLTHEFLRAAYKRAATRAHPDRGGSPAAFDDVTRAYLYLEEVLNKLIPKHVERMEKIPVTQEAALKAREAPLFSREAQAVPEGPPVSLNPKNLNMTVFNQLFEQNRLPDPDQDGYGEWLNSHQGSSQQSNDSLRAKFNTDVFNKTFVDGAKNANGQALAKYQHPDAIIHSAGVELGRDRPAQYTSALGAKTGYTDLKYAYGDGSTFSQEVAGVPTSTGKTFDQMKRERESAPVALSAEEFAAVQALDAQKKRAEEERLRRLAAQDVDAESAHMRLKQRLMIQ